MGIKRKGKKNSEIAILMASHADNRGSNPLGDARKFKGLSFGIALFSFWTHEWTQFSKSRRCPWKIFRGFRGMDALLKTRQ